MGLRQVMEEESQDRFGRMNDYMERKDRDEPFVWEVGSWLKQKLQDNRLNGFPFPNGKEVNMLDIGPAVGAVSSYLVMNALAYNDDYLNKVKLHLCDVSKEVIQKTLSGDFPIPYDIFQRQIRIDNARVDKLTQKVLSAEGKIGRGQQLPYDDNTFDITVANYILHHVPNADKGNVAREIQRVTKPRGIIFVADEYIPPELKEQYFARHAEEDIPLAKEDFMPMKNLLNRFDKLYLNDHTQGNEHYAFFGVNDKHPVLWQHNEYFRERQ